MTKHSGDNESTMRIAIVTAHYPPNFISGGTLIPQRIADGLAKRNHEVFVFAGLASPETPELVVDDEIAESGVKIRWVTSTHFTTWGSKLNFHNPGVEPLFVDFLAETNPDVVHFHSMQGLGGSLVSLAKATGAATAVTMHDQWWWCARQFLVNRQLQPCNSVPTCGICPCEVDNRWLVDRNDQLIINLRAADLVLAPSAAMVDQMAANGVDPTKIRLDENPAPATVEQAGRRHIGEATVRFVYAGGPHPLKGGQVAALAAQRLAKVPHWSLDMYGFDDGPVIDGLPDGPLRLTDIPNVQVHPRFSPDQVGAVLGNYDVLVMPSLAFESFSILTREALAAGCAIITGNNPGPCDVVTNDVNGLVVERGSVPDLAAAMQSLIEDRQKLRQLRGNVDTVQVRSVDEQIDGLEQMFGELARNRVGGAHVSKPIQRVLLASGIGGAPLRYRGQLPQEALLSVGIHMDVHHFRDVQVLNKAATADAVVLYRVPANQQIMDVISIVHGRDEPVPILFDVDDLIVDPTLAADLNPLLEEVGADLDDYWRGVRRYRTTLESCDGYIGSTKVLCDRIHELTGMPVFRFANGVGKETARISEIAFQKHRSPGPTRIGYFSGTNTHNHDWAAIEPTIVRILRDRPDTQLWLGGMLEVGPALAAFGKRIRRLPMMPWQRLPFALRDIDINLAPLVPGVIFNESKSAIKYLEAALVGTPTVATPTQPFREAITDGVTGLLADTPSSWYEKIHQLVDDVWARRQMGQAARQAVLMELSPGRQAHRYAEILVQARDVVARSGHRKPSPGWVPEIGFEPWMLAAVEAYDAGMRSGYDGDRTVGRILRDYRENAVTTLRQQGAGPTARKAASVMARAAAKVLRRK